MQHEDDECMKIYGALRGSPTQPRGSMMGGHSHQWAGWLRPPPHPCRLISVALTPNVSMHTHAPCQESDGGRQSRQVHVMTG